MSFSLQQELFRAEAAAFFAHHMTPAVRDELAERQDEYVPSFHRALGDEGWIGLQWPVEFGGRGLGHVEAAILQEEAAVYGAPMLASNLSSIIGNTMIEVGSESVKERYLPPTIRGDVVYCLGYSEAEAGSDLASLRTRAERTEGGWVITGAKMFTSLAHVAHYMVCAARTSVDGRAHDGITVFLVPMADVKVEPIRTLGGFRTNATFLDDVSVSDDEVLGGVDAGWHVLMTALDFERAGTARVGQAKRLLRLAAGSIDSSDTERLKALGQLQAEIAAAEIVAYEVAWLQSCGCSPTKEASMSKVIGTELVQRVADFGTDALGRQALLARGADGAPAEGELEEEYRNTVRFTVTAGTNEIQRNIIAQRGLALPRA